MGPAEAGNTELPLLSTVGWFSLLPELSYDGGLAAPSACHLALVAARGLPVVIGEDAQHVSQPATTPDEPAGGDHAEP